MSEPSQPALRRQLGLFDATMLVMGGIIGSGIFVNPAVVAQSVGGFWIVGVGQPTPIVEEGLIRLGEALDDIR